MLIIYHALTVQPTTKNDNDISISVHTTNRRERKGLHTVLSVRCSQINLRSVVSFMVHAISEIQQDVPQNVQSIIYIKLKAATFHTLPANSMQFRKVNHSSAMLSY